MNQNIVTVTFFLICTCSQQQMNASIVDSLKKGTKKALEYSVPLYALNTGIEFLKNKKKPGISTPKYMMNICKKSSRPIMPVFVLGAYFSTMYYRFNGSN